MTPRNAVAAAVASAVGFAPAALPSVATSTGIGERALSAYVAAANGPEACPGMRWQIIAGIYQKESLHGTHGGSEIGPDGVARPPIYGVPVGWMGGARAEGPGQFMPTSWGLFGEGDPQDIDQAATATVRHLCGTHGDVEGDHLRSAIVSYYGADRDGYADTVLANVAAYDQAGALEVSPIGDVSPSDDGLTLRITDRLIGRTLRGWDRLAGWMVGRNPDTAPTVGAIHRAVDGLTAPAGQRETVVSVSSSSVGGVVCPVAGATITSDYGDPRDGGSRQHAGIDLAHDEGAPIVAPFPARVVETVDVEADGGLGGISLWLEATSGPHKGARVYIAHNRRNTVSAGQTVAQGAQVAELGNTGVGSGPHAHVSWAPDGGAFTDPAPIRLACQEATR